MKSTTFLLALAVAARASSGDRDDAFQHCLSKRIRETCQQPVPLPLTLRLTRWTCEDDCKYQCAHIMTDNAMKEGRRPEQFYGKWAFWRFMGIQEPASVIFSLMNFGAHIRGGKALRRRIRKEHPMRGYYLGFTLASLNLWIWSTVFHTRDRPWTEKLDYFSAGLAVVYSLFYSVIRLYHLYIKPRSLIHGSSSRHRLLFPWATFCTLLYLAHVAYLSLLPRFDYGWNMKANITVALIHNFIWMSYSLPSPPFRRFRSVPNSYRPTYILQPAFVSVAITLAAGLEIFDFPPWWRVIDAHSLWHLATVPLIGAWYRFLIDDSSDLSWKEGLL
ncbi:hypothetical protein M408DRAFT_66610 [Serendipita vermifera MAFF 305830]|uniref:Post-GPI attachment to proteins factor 3 n=1 Tax=Serendipita vermifera MAFF 305830 TaxID=933852 RepID=A0A0C3BFQ8_SERVB|nr:hypothetical protein M408DRAFT_66610 [Serendipita vermifera MAFF 305830]